MKSIFIGGGSSTPSVSANDLTGTTLAPTVVNSSLTSIGTLSNLNVISTDTTTVSTTIADVANPVYIQQDWAPAADSAGVRFGAAVLARHTTGNSSTNHYGALLGYATKNHATGTDALVVGVEGRVGAVLGAITIGAAVLGTFNTNTEDAGTIEYGAAFYLPDQTDDGHITNKFAFWNNDSGWQVRSQGPINARGTLQQRDHNVEGATCWVNCDSTSGTPVNNGSFNVTSFTDLGAGQITVNMTNALAAGYKAVNATGALVNFCFVGGTNGTTSFTVYSYSLSTLTPTDGLFCATVHGGTQ